jgi:hypothetical protein
MSAASVLDEPFRSLWAGRIPSSPSRRSGEVFRELEGAAPCAPKSPGVATSSRFIAASAGPRSSRISFAAPAGARRAERVAGDPAPARTRRRQHARRRLRLRGHNPARQRRSSSPRNWRRRSVSRTTAWDWKKHPARAAPEARADRRVAGWRGECIGRASTIATSISVISFCTSTRRRPPTGCRLSLIDLHRAQVRAARRAAGATRIWRPVFFGTRHRPDAP